jgi:hypothetical protein
MKELRKLGIHGLLLLVACLAAFVKSRPEDEQSRPLEPGEVELWSAEPEDVARVEYTAKRKKVALERQKDQAGLYYLGKVEPVEEPPKDDAATDAGADAGAPKPPPPVQAESFVSVSVADKIVKKLAPMRAKRLIGEVAPDREPVFGLDDPDGTLVVEVGDKKYEFVVGDTAPGSGDRYVRFKKDNLVYIVEAEIIRDLDAGASRLTERQQHEWKTTDVEKAAILAGDARRDVVRSGTEGRRYWADPQKPDVNDETAGNWLGKVDRLRPVKFLDAMPAGAERVVRVEYRSASSPLGFLELHRYKDGDKTEYVVVSEYLRKPATVTKTVAEQVEDDLASMLGLAAREKDPEEAATAEPGEPEPPVPPDPHGHGAPPAPTAAPTTAVAPTAVPKTTAAPKEKPKAPPAK